MDTMPIWVQLVYLACAISFILALKGLSGPKTARNGNLLGAAAATVAVIVPFFYLDLDNKLLIIVAIAIGTIAGAFGAQKVQMTQMPQMVALFNGVGGGAAALVALLELSKLVEIDDLAGDGASKAFLVATAFTIFVGAVSFAGSVVTFAKLQELMTSRPVVFPGLPVAFIGGFVAALVLSGLAGATGYEGISNFDPAFVNLANLEVVGLPLPETAGLLQGAGLTIHLEEPSA